MKLKILIKAIIGQLPILNKYLRARTDRGGRTADAKYCYSVWIRHYIRAKNAHFAPKTVLEVGSGNSLGVGICAYLSGCEEYVGTDVMTYEYDITTTKVYKDILELFRNKTEVLVEDVKPDIEFRFPFTDDELARNLAEERLEKITDHVKFQKIDDIEQRFNFIMSQSVFQYVDNIRAMRYKIETLLLPAGLMSHVIDYKGMGFGKRWDSYQDYKDWEWKLVKKTRPFTLNRVTHQNFSNYYRGHQVFRLITEENVYDGNKVQETYLQVMKIG